MTGAGPGLPGGSGSVKCGTAGGHSHSVPRPHSMEKLYKCHLCIYVYSDGRVELAKNRFGYANEDAHIDQIIPILTRIIAEVKLKDTHLDMFKEGLSELLQEAIKPILEGKHYERTICAKSAGDGS